MNPRDRIDRKTPQAVPALRMPPFRAAPFLALPLVVVPLAFAPAAAQEMGGPGTESAGPRPGAKLERVEVQARPQSDTDLRRQASVAKQVYGREELEKFGDTNIADVLRRLPGVNMQGGAPRMRGLGAGYTLILINGDPAPPGFQFDQLDPAQVLRIEVAKAPTADQSAQAVAGSINIILKEAPRVRQRDARVGVSYTAVRPVPSATFTQGERIGDWSYTLPVSAFEWRGLNSTVLDRTVVDAMGVPSRSVQFGEQDVWGHGFNTSPRITWRRDESENLTLQSFIQKGNWHNRQLYRNGLLSGPTPVPDPELRFEGGWEMLRGNLQWTKRLDDDRRLELKLGVQRSGGTFDGTTSLQRRAFGENRDRNLTQSGRYAQLIGDEHTLALGWELETRRREEERTVTQNGVPLLLNYEGQPFIARIARQALFIQDEWEISPRWSTYLGLRGERIRTTGEGLGTAPTNSSQVVTPMWHLNHKLDAKGRELVRASLTRSYKAPDPGALLARPAISAVYGDLTRGNTEASPDRLGNPALKPELATGLDLAYERYLDGGGLFTIGGFHRRVRDLVRNVTTLQTVDWALVPRYVAQPINIAAARTTGLEMELKGRAGELMPALFAPTSPLNLRAAINVYRSTVEGIPGPDNRLDGQQPWSANFGADYRVPGLPVTVGGSLAYTPGYYTQQTAVQYQDLSRVRSIDVYALWNVDRRTSLRVAANNVSPVDALTVAGFAGGDVTATTRSPRTAFNLGLEFKL